MECGNVRRDARASQCRVRKLFIPLKNYLILEGNYKYAFAPTWLNERRCYNRDTS
jgi:hypothetical protein